MPDWAWWFIAAAALAAGEIATIAFILGPLAVAAALAGVVGLAGVSVALQVVTFAAASIAALLVIRPIARRHLRQPATTRTGVDALRGTTAVVVERVDVDSGQVRIGGEIWSARAYNEHEVLEPGTHVLVLEIKGATALVAP